MMKGLDNGNENRLVCQTNKKQVSLDIINGYLYINFRLIFRL